MRSFLIVTCLVLLTSITVIADQPDDGYMGPNNLRNNPNLTIYQEGSNGVPTFVQGDLLANKAGRGNEFEAAISYFEQNRGAYRMSSPVDELTLRRSETDQYDNTHVRVDQNYKGLKVIGGELVAHFKSDGTLKAVNGYYLPYLDIDINPVVLPDLATAIASEDLLTFFGEAKPDQAELVVFPWEGKDYLAWRLFLYSSTPMGRWEYFIDAKTGEVIFKANRIMDANDIGTGTSVMGLTRNHIDTDYTGSTYQARDYTRQLLNNPHGHDGQMPAGKYIQTNIASTSLPGSIATDADNIWGTTEAQKPVVDGQVYTAKVYDYLLEHFGRNSYDNNGSNMLTSVNYSAEGDNNAYWNGDQIVIWSWGTGWRSLAGCPDVIAHEWGHAVTETASGLAYQLESGALNESFSDMIGAAFEWAHDTLDTPDWDMGENGRLTGVGFRSMDEPHEFTDPDYYGTSDPYWVDVDGCSPSYYNDYCGVHTNSGVGNKWYFLLSDGGTHHGITVTGIGSQNAILVAYQANVYYWTSNTTYSQAALGTISAALDLDPGGTWASRAASAWNAVGVSTPGPSVMFSYPNGIPETVFPGQQATFEVLVSGYLSGTPVHGSGKMYYAIDDGPYDTLDMAEISSHLYQAVLPEAFCGSSLKFYFSANEFSSGIYYDHSSSDPYSAGVATSMTVAFDDNFETNQGWTVSGDAGDGQWNRGIPAGGGERGDPPTDFDGSGQCYLTDNVYGNSDVDNGTTTLTSPTFDLSEGDALVHYARWYSNNYGANPNQDVFRVYISNNNGSSWTKCDSAGPSSEANGGWVEHSFYASEFVTPTALMKVRFDASDDVSLGSVVEAGIDDFTVTAVECYDSTLVITTQILPDWTVGQYYSYQLMVIGGTEPITWNDKNDDLTGTGLGLSSSGLLSGTPVSAGPLTFMAEATDANLETSEKSFNFTINPAVQIITTALPNWTAGYAYNVPLQGTGGTAPVIWADKNGELSGTGLSLSENGQLSGTPTAGAVSFTAQFSDSTGSVDEQLLTCTINPALQITTLAVANWTEGFAFSQQLNSSGGTGTIDWSDKNNNLAGTGLTLSATGLLSGTPSSSGQKSFTARVIDDILASNEKQFIFTINAPIQVTTTTVPAWTAGVAYSQQLNSSGGTSPSVWSDVNNDLDGSGLSLSASGLLSGIPSSDGSLVFTAGVADAVGSSDDQELTLLINPAVAITTTSLPEGEETVAYSYQMLASGGTGSINWLDKNNDLAGTGLTLSATGLLSGTPTLTGFADFTARISDQVGSSDESNFTINIGVPYICGDANADESVNVSDAVYIINYVFISGSPAPDPLLAGEVNCDSNVNVSDAVYIINYVFISGSPAPCECETPFAK